MKKKWNEGMSGFLVAAALVAAAPIGSAQATAVRLAPGGGAAATSTSDRAYLGVYVEGEGDNGGVKLGAVVPGSPAEKAGLKEGDVIVALADRTIGSESELRDAIAAFGVGSKVKVTFLRDGEKRRTSARLATAPAETESEEGDESAEAPEIAAPIELTPMETAEGTEASGGYLGVQLEPMDGGGAKVLEVVDGSPAAKAGVESGDVIVKVDGNDIDSADALVSAIRGHHAGDAVKLTVERNGERQKIKATLASRSGMAIGGGAGMPAPAAPAVPAPSAHATRRPSVAGSAVAPAEAQQTKRELDELRREIQELRQRCEQQQRTIDAIRQALDGNRSPGSTSMAAPTGVGSPTTLSLAAGDAGSALFTLAAPSDEGGASAGAIAFAAAPPSDDSCCASAPAAEGAACCADPTSVTVMGSGDPSCSTTCTEGGEATFEVVSAGDGDDDDAGSTMVWTGVGGMGQGKAVKVHGNGSGQHVFKIVVTDDGRAQVESMDPAQQGVFFGTVGNSDDAQVAAPKHAGKKASVQFHGQAQKSMQKAMPKAMKVKGVKLSPKAKAQAQQHAGAFEFVIEDGDGGADDGDAGHPANPHVRVMRMPGMPGMGGPMGPKGPMGRMGAMGGMPGHPPIAVPPMRARIAMPGFQVHPQQQGECNGSCAAHCPARQIVVAHSGHDGGHEVGNRTATLQCSGPCTLVINGGQCELRCEGGECQLSGAAACEECEEYESTESAQEENEEEDDDDSSSVSFDLMQVGDEGDFQLMQVGGDDDDDNCCSDADGDDHDSCCSDDDDGDDCCGDDDGDDDDGDEGDINYL